MSSVDEKRAPFHQYLASSGAFSNALIKLYEEPNKPDDPVNFVRRQMGIEDFFILSDGKVQNEEEELVLSSLIDKKSEETVVCNVADGENVASESEQEVVNDEDNKQTEERETANVEAVEGMEDTTEPTVQEDDQSTSEFEKLTSDEDCNSLLKIHLTDEIVEKLKNLNSEDGVTVYDCIKPGLEHHDSVLGIYATTLQCYGLFSDIFDPIIESYHGFGGETIQSNSDWGDSQAFEPFNEVVMSIRITCMRNMQECPTVCRMGESDLNDSLAKIKAITEGFEDASKGTFYPIADLTEDQESELKLLGGVMDSSDKHSSSANVYQQWPVGRGIFVTDDKSMIIHINGKDHLKFISRENGNEFGKIYQRLVDTVSLLELPFVRHDRLGWLTFSPANLGTALSIAIDSKLPKLRSNPDKLQEIIKSSPIQLKLSESDAENNVYTLSNLSTMGHAELDLAKHFYYVVQAIIESESGAEDE